VYAIIDETSEELDANNNPIINPENVRRGANHMAEGDTEEIVAARVKVQLTTAEWDTIKATIIIGQLYPSIQEEKYTGIPLCPASAVTAVGKGKKKN
jgi:hypothetical protein